MTTKFSIIVPAYNVAAYLPDCVESVLSQEMSDFELVLVNDGSTDDTLTLCQKFAATDSRIVVINQANAGLSAARNAGVKKASGEYLLFLDGDDLFTPTALARLSAALTTFSTPVDLLRFQTQDLLPDGTIIPHPEPGFAPLPGPQAFPRLARCHYTENAWLYCYRTAFFKSHHFSYAAGRLAEDFGLTPLVIGSAASVAAIPDICYTYRARPGSIMHDSAKLRTRVADAFAGLEYQLPRLAALGPAAAPISHYLAVSFLTLATTLPPSEYLYFYRQFKAAGFHRFIHPRSLRSLPRSLLLLCAPRLYRRIFRPAKLPL